MSALLTALAVLWVAALGCCSIATPPVQYAATGNCEDQRLCVYRYAAGQSYFEGKWNVTLTVTVEVECSSVGLYNGNRATKSCMEIRDASISGELFTSESEETRKEQYAAGSMFDGKFCFVQTRRGKVVAVYHTSQDDTAGLNVKRAIAAAFQASFSAEEEEEEEEEEDVEEEDMQSKHTAHYRRSHPDSDTVVLHRSVSSRDVKEYSSDVPRREVTLVSEEDMEYRNHILRHASGLSHVELLNRHRKRLQREGSLRFTAWSYYSLDLVRCYELPATVRGKRSLQSKQNEKELVRGSLMATSDPKTKATQKLSHISIAEALKKLQEDPTNKHTLKEVSQMLRLESAQGMPPAQTPVVNALITLLHQTQSFVVTTSDEAVRISIYYLLSVDSSYSAFMAFLDSLKGISHMSKTEKNALLASISTLKQAHLEFVLGIEALIDARHEQSDPLLLSYAALASEAMPDVEEHIVAFLLSRFDRVHHDNNEEIVHFLHALGNTGSKHAITTILSYLSGDNEEVEMAAIFALRKLTNRKRVQRAFIGVLQSDLSSTKVVAIVKVLSTGEELTEMISGEEIEYSPALITALSVASRQLGSEEVTQLVLAFFKSINVDSSAMTDKLSRRRRQATWDTPDPDYDLITLQQDRENCMLLYPCHYSRLWKKTLGTPDINIRAVAGVFTGVAADSNHFKIFGRAVVKVQAFGNGRTVFDACIKLSKEDDKVHLKVYLAILGNVLLDQDHIKFTDCVSNSTQINYNYRLPLPTFDFDFILGDISVDFQFQIEIVLEVWWNVCSWSDVLGATGAGTYSIRGATGFVPSVTATFNGGASVEILSLGRIGISLDGSINYKGEADGHAAMCPLSLSSCENSSQSCVRASHQWNRGYVSLNAWYQTRSIRYCNGPKIWSFQTKYPCGFNWGSVRNYPPLSNSWRLNAFYETIFDNCNDIDNYECPVPPTTATIATTVNPGGECENVDEEEEEECKKKEEEKEEEVEVEVEVEDEVA